MEKNKQPDFKQIYTDIIISKFPHKYDLCEYLLSKNELLALDILKLNTIIFGTSEKEAANTVPIKRLIF